MNMKKTLVIFPTTFEAKKVFSSFAKFAKKKKFLKKNKLSVGDFFEADANEIFKNLSEKNLHSEFCFLISGVGCEKSAKRVAEICENFKPTHVVLAGFAGACDPNLKIGDLLHQTEDEIFFAAAKDFSRRCIIGCSDHFVESEEKRSLFENANVEAVEMESDIFRNVFAAQNLDYEFSHFRCVSDIADSDVNFEQLGFRMDIVSGELNFSTAIFLKSIILNPTQIRQFFKLIFRAAKAQKIYDEAIIKILKNYVA